MVGLLCFRIFWRWRNVNTGIFDRRWSESLWYSLISVNNNNICSNSNRQSGYRTLFPKYLWKRLYWIVLQPSTCSWLLSPSQFDAGFGIRHNDDEHGKIHSSDCCCWGTTNFGIRIRRSVTYTLLDFRHSFSSWDDNARFTSHSSKSPEKSHCARVGTFALKTANEVSDSFSHFYDHDKWQHNSVGGVFIHSDTKSH